MTDSSGSGNRDRQERTGEQVLSELKDALRPALSEIGERVSDAVSDTLRGDNPGENDESGSSDESDDDQTIVGEAIDEAEDFVEDQAHDAMSSTVDAIVDPLFSRQMQRHARRWADERLQQAVWELVNSIDDDAERISLYRDILSTFRPVVRTALDAVFAVNTRYELKDEIKTAVPLLMRGDVDGAVAHIGNAFDHVVPEAREALSQNPEHMLWLLQRLSTALLEEKVQETAEEALESADIEGRVQQKAEEARGTLQEKITALQESVGHAQDQLRDISGTSRQSGRGRPGMPPSGLPPHGFPPHGRPPSGRPPFGRPPKGFPPSGLPPAVERRRKEAESKRSR